MSPHFKQARAYSLALFAYLETQGFCFNEDSRNNLIRLGWDALATHLKALRVRPKSIDGFKVISFVGFEVLKSLNSNSTDIQAHISPTRIGSSFVVRKMAALLALETSNGTILKEQDVGYLAEMSLNEIENREEVGIGPNGLAAVFSMLGKYGTNVPDLEKL